MWKVQWGYSYVQLNTSESCNDLHFSCNRQMAPLLKGWWERLYLLSYWYGNIMYVCRRSDADGCLKQWTISLYTFFKILFVVVEQALPLIKENTKSGMHLATGGRCCSLPTMVLLAASRPSRNLASYQLRFQVSVPLWRKIIYKACTIISQTIHNLEKLRTAFALNK